MSEPDTTAPNVEHQYRVIVERPGEPPWIEGPRNLKHVRYRCDIWDGVGEQTCRIERREVGDWKEFSP